MPFSISNGTRQGCPLSPLIFNLLMEPLAIYIRTHPHIKGFPSGEGCHTISLFTDDIILIMTDVESSLAAAHETLAMFNHISYYKVSDSKSHILGLGINQTLQTKQEMQYTYSWNTISRYHLDRKH